MLLNYTRTLGDCDSCAGEGTIEKGLQATVKGILDKSTTPPTLSIASIESIEVGCPASSVDGGEDGDGDGDGDEDGETPTLAPGLSPAPSLTASPVSEGEDTESVSTAPAVVDDDGASLSSSPAATEDEDETLSPAPAAVEDGTPTAEPVDEGSGGDEAPSVEPQDRAPTTEPVDASLSPVAVEDDGAPTVAPTDDGGDTGVEDSDSEGEAEDDDSISTTPAGFNCEPLSEDFHVRWKVESDDQTLAIELLGTIGQDNYMSFGRSGAEDASSMDSSDVVVADITPDGEVRAVDFTLGGRFECDGGEGVCPDTNKRGGLNDVFDVSGDRQGDLTLVRYKIPMIPADYDAEFEAVGYSVDPGALTYVVWAIGPITPEGQPQHHSSKAEIDFAIDFGRNVVDNCPSLGGAGTTDGDSLTEEEGSMSPATALGDGEELEPSLSPAPGMVDSGEGVEPTTAAPSETANPTSIDGSELIPMEPGESPSSSPGGEMTGEQTVETVPADEALSPPSSMPVVPTHTPEVPAATPVGTEEPTAAADSVAQGDSTSQANTTEMVTREEAIVDDGGTIGGGDDIASTPVDFNCEPMSGDFQIRWQVQGGLLSVELLGRIAENNYMAFGISGNADSTAMVGSDVVVADMSSPDGKARAVDYHLGGQISCDDGYGVCPDTVAGGDDDVGDVSGVREGGLTLIRYKRPLISSDYGADLPESASQVKVEAGAFNFIVWAIGPMGDSGIPQLHTSRTEGDVSLEFGRTTVNNCPFMGAESAPAIEDQFLGVTHGVAPLPDGVGEASAIRLPRPDETGEEFNISPALNEEVQAQLQSSLDDFGRPIRDQATDP